MSIEAGTKLDGYESIQKIGAGGMGEVYRRDNSLNILVAEAVKTPVPGK